MDSRRLLDEVGLRILRELQEDARLTHSEIGRRVGLSQPAVAERIQRLEEAGIITGYRVELDLERLGLPIVAFVRVTTTDVKSGHIDRLVEKLPEVLECYRVTGTESYIMRIAVTSVHHLEQFILQLLPFGQPTTNIVLSPTLPHRVVMPPRAAQPAAGHHPREDPHPTGHHPRDDTPSS